MKDRTDITIRNSGIRLVLIFVFSVCLYFCLCLVASVAPAYAVTVGKVEITGLHSIEKEEMLDMLGFREGDDINAESLRSGIKRAFRKAIFDDISVDISDDDPCLVTVQVSEKDIIRNVKVQGNYTASSRRVRDLLSLKEGQVMRYDLIGQAEGELKDQFAQMGYPEAKIDIMASRSMNHRHNVTVTVTIEEGPSLDIKDVRIVGTDLVRANDLRISSGDVYDQIKIGKELQRIKELLRKDGYYKPDVDRYVFQDGILTVSISPGKNLKTIVEGNNTFSVKRLEKEMPFFESEMFNDEAVDEAVSRMISLYHSAGYPFAQIAPVVRADGQNVQVTFFIYEGIKIEVRAIEFTGTTIAQKSLQNVLELKEGEPYNPDLRDRDRDTLKEYYSALGFLDASVSEIEASIDEAAGKVDLIIAIDEGLRTTIDAIDVAGVAQEKKENLLALIMIREGAPYNEVEISDARFRILDQYSREGYANIDVRVQRTIEDRRADVLFTVSEGRKKTIGRTVITGNEQTRFGVIKREIADAEDTPYSFSALARKRQKLYKLGLFTDVEIEASDADDDQKDLLVRVKEGKAGIFEFGFGYAEYEQYRSFFEIGYRNLFGYNRQGLFRTEFSSLERRFILQYNEPWFMGNPLPLRVMFLHENKKELTIPGRVVRYQLERDTVSVGIEKKLLDSLKSELYYEFSIVKTTDIQPDVILSREDVGTLAISAIRSSLYFDTRDNPFEPKKGILAGMTLKIASPLLFSETHFVKATVFASLFHQIHKRVVLGLSAHGGIAYGFGMTTELPIVERYFLGGRSSVRGYEQDMLGPKGSDGNPTGGNAFAAGNVELRIDVGRNISIVPFIDLGNVWLNTSDFSLTDIKYTAGVGLRYATPVGPLRVDYGFKLNRRDICTVGPAQLTPQCEPESGGAIHFSIGHAF